MRGPGLGSDLEGIHHAVQQARQPWRWPTAIAGLALAFLHALEVQLGITWFFGVWDGVAHVAFVVYVVAPAVVAFAVVFVATPPLGRHILSAVFVVLGLVWVAAALFAWAVTDLEALLGMRWWQTTALPVALANVVVLGWLVWPTTRLQRRAAFGAVAAAVPALVSAVVAVALIGAP